MAAAVDKPTLGYWNIRGLAQPVRMLLCHKGVKFEDKQYDCLEIEEGKYDASCWHGPEDGDKVKLRKGGMLYPNLPYFKDGETQLSQTNAVLTYCAEKYGLHDGFSVEERGLALMHLNQVMDVRNAAIGQFYSFTGKPDHSEEGFRKYGEKITTMFGVFKVGDGYLLGEKVCAADFHLAEMVYQHRLLDEKIFAEMGPLVKYQEKIFALDGVSNACQGLPCNNKMAAWGAEPLNLDN